MSQSEEFIPLLGEIRDQLKRIADVLKAITIKGESNLNVELGEPTIQLRERDVRKNTDAIRGYSEK